MNTGGKFTSAAILKLVAALAISAQPAGASYGIYVGKNLTADGSVFLAGYGDEPSSHWLEIVPRARLARRGHDHGRRHGGGAAIPGELIEIPQVRRHRQVHHHELLVVRRLSRRR